MAYVLSRFGGSYGRPSIEVIRFSEQTEKPNLGFLISGFDEGARMIHEGRVISTEGNYLSLADSTNLFMPPNESRAYSKFLNDPDWNEVEANILGITLPRAIKSINLENPGQWISLTKSRLIAELREISDFDYKEAGGSSADNDEDNDEDEN